MHVYTLYDLNEFIRRVIALNFQQPIWITAEIGQVSPSKGHYFLDLLQKNEGSGAADIIAQMQAVLWSKDYFRLRADLGKDLDEVLREGLEVKMRVRVDFNERYGMKLIVEEIDPSFTFGQQELQRRQTIRRLQELKLFEKNSQLPLPSVLQRIAVVTSESAAGYQDFREHLLNNPYQYGYSLQLFTSTMQGNLVETELPSALAKISAKAADFDCVVILRGGGARLDLSAFDGLEVCKAIAKMPLPILTGIGHDIDETVADLTAHTALKTPTAVADFLIQNNFYFENSLLQLAEGLRQFSKNQLNINTLYLERTEQQLHWASRERLKSAEWKINQVENNLPRIAQQNLQQKHQKLSEMERIVSAYNPENTLKRGFSMTFHQGKLLRSLDTIKNGDILETRLKDGTLRSEVIQ